MGTAAHSQRLIHSGPFAAAFSQRPIHRWAPLRWTSWGQCRAALARWLIHSGSFTAAHSQRLIHSVSFTAAHSQRLIHSGSGQVVDRNDCVVGEFDQGRGYVKNAQGSVVAEVNK